ncbi:DUF1801 domain-containing protein [Alteromonas sp. ASW11-36]|uniref:DUF1801 domain-containing protein n=1 Tax=Alteromonas arenosi TaxID=3055817 RepID=A0ABT7T2V8_9ALTE|nr:DUF1801 domain-containing protein [Alteromonas sp. ASW11-36]MDM7862094.1 DUF1801 domain-containing protein [Alteromonas sp. ASW11-36]
MQHNCESPQAYMASLDQDWRKALIEDISASIRSLAPDSVPFIKYGMLAFGTPEAAVQVDGDAICCMNAQKNYVSVYVGDVKRVDPTGAVFQTFDCGRSCVRIKRTKAAQTDTIQQLLVATVDDWRQRIS